jgi:uracil-DNA glycosylase family 4
MKVKGKGHRGFLIVGEAPGELEDERGRPFVGKTGRLLRDTSRKFGFDLFEDGWLTNTLRCRPRGNAPPTDKQIKCCRPNLINAIKELSPQVVLLLGGPSVKSIMGYLWKEGVKGGITRWAGNLIPSIKINAWVCPTFHPSYISRSEGKQDGPMLTRMWEKHLEAAYEITSRPWKQPPDLKDLVTIIYDPTDAAREIRRFIKAGKPVAFDFETDRLKPDHPDARIHCCSVSDGHRTISFPWMEEAIKASKELFLSDTPKYGWNSKFEHRWVMATLGVEVRNWLLDGMIGNHIIDFRRGVNGLKYQAFVKYGVGDYDSHIGKYLKPRKRGANHQNRIKEADLRELLLYCGLDSLLEHWLCSKQSRSLL